MVKELESECVEWIHPTRNRAALENAVLVSIKLSMHSLSPNQMLLAFLIFKNFEKCAGLLALTISRVQRLQRSVISPNCARCEL